MTPEIWAAVIGGGATIVAALVGLLAHRRAKARKGSVTDQSTPDAEIDWTQVADDLEHPHVYVRKRAYEQIELALSCSQGLSQNVMGYLLRSIFDEGLTPEERAMNMNRLQRAGAWRLSEQIASLWLYIGTQVPQEVSGKISAFFSDVDNDRGIRILGRQLKSLNVEGLDEPRARYIFLALLNRLNADKPSLPDAIIQRLLDGAKYHHRNSPSVRSVTAQIIERITGQRPEEPQGTLPDPNASAASSAEPEPSSGQQKNWDVFICHATEDKESVVVPLAEILRDRYGLKVWLDKWAMTIGDSLRRKIDEGLAGSRFGVVIISKAFFSRQWPQNELDGLVQREIDGKKVILPVWHKITREEVTGYSPMLAGRLAARIEDGLPAVAEEIRRAIAAEGSDVPPPEDAGDAGRPVSVEAEVDPRGEPAPSPLTSPVSTARTIRLRCKGVTDGNRWLAVDEAGRVVLTGRPTDPGTRWEAFDWADGQVLIRSLDSPRNKSWLHGKKDATGRFGNVTLESSEARMEPGAKWRLVEAGDTVFKIECEGTKEETPHLNGRTKIDDSKVDLAPLNRERSGTHWEIMVDAGAPGGYRPLMAAETRASRIKAAVDFAEQVLQGAPEEDLEALNTGLASRFLMEAGKVEREMPAQQGSGNAQDLKTMLIEYYTALSDVKKHLAAQCSQKARLILRELKRELSDLHKAIDLESLTSSGARQGTELGASEQEDDKADTEAKCPKCGGGVRHAGTIQGHEPFYYGRCVRCGHVAQFDPGLQEEEG